MAAQSVQFAPFASFVDAAFWSTLVANKLHEYRLDTSPKPMVGYYVNSDSPGYACCRLTVDYNSLNVASAPPRGSVAVSGHLLLVNTIEDFRAIARQRLLDSFGEQIWSSFDGANLGEVEQHFIFTVFADLKRYKFHYWVGVPALCYPDSLRYDAAPKALTDCDEQLAESLVSAAEAFDAAAGSPSAFLLHQSGSQLVGRSLDALLEQTYSDSNVVLVFKDPSTHKLSPGWPLRNLLAAIARRRADLARLRVLCWRRHGGQSGHSLYLTVAFCRPSVDSRPSVVGWERDADGRLAPRFVDMSRSMDPVNLADAAVDLNLQLMKWRLAPDLDLDRMRNLRCLLLGAGTLGCNVARYLVGWGVRQLTLVDSGTVSLSNPARQSLFTFADSQDGGRPKADAAADALRRILPSARVKAHVLQIPMPGHVVGPNDEQQTREAITLLESLVESHDVLFLLLDSREARWLPTLLAAAHSKIALTAALGFDTFVVIRHGATESDAAATAALPSSLIAGERLGCYFCCDVTAPGNSTRDRTLDQQCTVSRPGSSAMAAALAVELLAALLQHPDGARAAAALGDAQPASADGPLGAVPHQIRGCLFRFDQLTPAVSRFDSCVACSRRVVDAYRAGRSTFLLNVFNTAGYLEQVTGLAELQAGADLVQVWEFSDNESVKSADSK